MSIKKQYAVVDNKVKFDEVNVKLYLDEVIAFWRESGADYSGYYVDAYQSMRMSLFGELKNDDEDLHPNQ